MRLKIGLSIGGSLVAGILAYYVQPDLVAQSQKPCMAQAGHQRVLFDSVPCLRCPAVPVRNDKQMESRIELELGARRAQAGA